MDLAVELAKKGEGHTWKNPLVGAVIVKNKKIIAQGYHHRFGTKHAEVDALSQLNDINYARGATIYVTLEPCSHFGKTGPCAEKLVEVGIKRVVIGQVDPNPLVSGKGIKILKSAGIETVILNNTFSLNSTYNFFFQNKRPLITAKYAMTLDGKINYEAGQRSIVSNQKSFEDSQLLRVKNQAILVGEGTFINDNPLLTVRATKPDFPPVRVILINNIDQLKADLNIFKDDSNIIFFTREATKRKWPSNVEVLVNQKWSPTQIVDELFRRGIQSLLIEGGSRTHALFFANDLVDKVVVYVTPKIFGGKGLPAVTGEAMQKRKFKMISREKLVEDTKFVLERMTHVYRNN